MVSLSQMKGQNLRQLVCRNWKSEFTYCLAFNSVVHQMVFLVLEGEVGLKLNYVQYNLNPSTT